MKQAQVPDAEELRAGGRDRQGGCEAGDIIAGVPGARGARSRTCSRKQVGESAAVTSRR